MTMGKKRKKYYSTSEVPSVPPQLEQDQGTSNEEHGSDNSSYVPSAIGRSASVVQPLMTSSPSSATGHRDRGLDKENENQQQIVGRVTRSRRSAPSASLGSRNQQDKAAITGNDDTQSTALTNLAHYPLFAIHAVAQPNDVSTQATGVADVTAGNSTQETGNIMAEHSSVSYQETAATNVDVGPRRKITRATEGKNPSELNRLMALSTSRVTRSTTSRNKSLQDCESPVNVDSPNTSERDDAKPPGTETTDKRNASKDDSSKTVKESKVNAPVEVKRKESKYVCNNFVVIDLFGHRKNVEESEESESMEDDVEM